MDLGSQDNDDDEEEIRRQIEVLGSNKRNNKCERESPQFEPRKKVVNEEIECLICKLKFDTQANLNKHRTIHWKKVELSNGNEGTIVQSPGAEDRPKTIFFPCCSKGQANEDQHRCDVQHPEEVNKIPVLNSAAPSAVRSYVETLDNVGDGGTPAASSETAADLNQRNAQNHRLFNDKNRTYNCRDCEFKGNSSKNLLQHKKESLTCKNMDSTAEKCYTCGIVYEDFEKLMLHRRTDHLDKINKCRYYKDNLCRFKSTCWYKHEEDEIAPSQPKVAAANTMGFQKAKETFPPDLIQLIKDSLKECLQDMFQPLRENIQERQKSPGA